MARKQSKGATKRRVKPVSEPPVDLVAPETPETANIPPENIPQVIPDIPPELPEGIPQNKKVIEKTLILSEADLPKHLKQIQKQFGYIADFAAFLGVSPQFAGDCLNGRKSPGKEVLAKLGITPKKVYEVSYIEEVD
jgi:hypothetical protein